MSVERREAMSPQSGYEFDKDGNKFDVVKWRQDVQALLGGGTPSDPLDVNIVGNSGDIAKVDSDGQLHVVTEGKICTENTTTTPLAGDAVFTGTAISTLKYSVILVAVWADQPSAIDGLSVQFSTDGINWRWDDKFTIDANTGKTFSFQPVAEFVRVVYTNGSVAQTTFDLQVIKKKAYCKPSSHRIADPISGQDDSELVKAVITGENPNNDFINFQSTLAGNFRVAIDEYGDTPSIDAFARLRVSEPYTLFDSKQLHDKQPLFWDEELGGTATSTHSVGAAAVQMRCPIGTTSHVIRQTKQRFNYQPGKSQLIFFTFKALLATGVRSRMGPFYGAGVDNLVPQNGIFFEVNGTTVSWNIAKGAAITESVGQESWNVDPLDGTGPSGVTLDHDATQICIVDYEWLGVGRVRVGFVVDGIIRYCHYFNHANDPTFSEVYMSTPNLPLRYSVEADGTNTVEGQLDHICSMVVSEGGQQKTGVLRSVESYNGFSNTLGGGTGTKHALCGIKLKAAYDDVTVIPEDVTIVLNTGDNFKWELHLNPTINGTWAYNDLADSAVQTAQVGTATNNTIAVDGTIIARGGGSDRTRSTASELLTALRLGSTIAGVQDELVLVLGLLDNNIQVWASLDFRELL